MRMHSVLWLQNRWLTLTFSAAQMKMSVTALSMAAAEFTLFDIWIWTQFADVGVAHVGDNDLSFR